MFIRFDKFVITKDIIHKLRTWLDKDQRIHNGPEFVQARWTKQRGAFKTGANLTIMHACLTITTSSESQHSPGLGISVHHGCCIDSMKCPQVRPHNSCTDAGPDQRLMMVPEVHMA